jgi:hypothetical protein
VEKFTARTHRLGGFYFGGWNRDNYMSPFIAPSIYYQKSFSFQHAVLLRLPGRASSISSSSVHSLSSTSPVSQSLCSSASGSTTDVSDISMSCSNISRLVCESGWDGALHLKVMVGLLDKDIVHTYCMVRSKCVLLCCNKGSGDVRRFEQRYQNTSNVWVPFLRSL